MTDDHDPPQDPIGSDLVRDDPSFGNIVLDFVDGLGDRVAVMEDALRSHDFDALCAAAQQLKGIVGGHGYPALTEEAGKLEQFARKQLLDECASKMAELREICARVMAGDDE